MADTPVQGSRSLWSLFATVKNLDKISDEFWNSANDEEFDDLSGNIEEKIDSYKYMEDMYERDADRLREIAATFLEKAKVQDNRAVRIRKRLINSLDYWGIDRAQGKLHTAIRSKRRDSRPTFKRAIPDETDLLKYPNCVRIDYQWRDKPDFLLANRFAEEGLIEKQYFWDLDMVKNELLKSGDKPAISEVAEIRELPVFKWDVRKKV